MLRRAILIAAVAATFSPATASADVPYDWSVVLSPGESVEATCFGPERPSDFHAYRLGRPMRQSAIRTGWQWTFAGSDSTSARVVYSRRTQRARNVGPTRVRFTVWCEGATA